MGYRYSLDEVLAVATNTALDHGMAGLTYARVAERLGASDRMVVYYFPSKIDLVVSVATQLGNELQELLGEAFGENPATTDELLAAAWPVLSNKRADRIFGLFFEMIGFASAGQAPYVELVRHLMDSWAEWLSERVIGSRPEIRRRRALSVMARIDGLLMIRRVMGIRAADAAAQEVIPRL